MHFGEHITIDGYGGSKSKLSDKDLIHKVLVDLPSKLGMKIFSGPHLKYCGGGSPKDDGGWSGVVLINESHISIHNFPDAKFLTADVYTCKNGMNVKYVENYFKKKFSLKDVEVNFIKRGTRYSQNLK